MARLRCCRYGRSALPDQLTRDGINTELLPLRRSILREHFDFGVDEMRVPQHLLPGLAGAGVAVVGFECQRFRGAGTTTFSSSALATSTSGPQPADATASTRQSMAARMRKILNPHWPMCNLHSAFC